jgi:hypothetical protein
MFASPLVQPSLVWAGVFAAGAGFPNCPEVPGNSRKEMRGDWKTSGEKSTT